MHWPTRAPPGITRVVRRLALLLLLGACTAIDPASELAAPGCALVPLGQVPVEVVADVPIVTVAIGGVPVRMILDTGATLTVIAPALAAQLRLAQTGPAVVMEAAGGRTQAIPVLLPDVQIGQVRLRGVPAIAGRALGGVSDGVLGLSLLRAFELDLDLPNRTLTLYQVRRCDRLAPPWTGPYEALPTARSVQGQMVMPISVNGTVLQAVIDTGNSLTFITRQGAERAGVGALLVSAAPAGRARTFTPTGVAVSLVPFERLDVGATTMRNPVLLVGELPAAAGDALLGGDYFTTHRVWLALAAGRAWAMP